MNDLTQVLADVFFLRDATADVRADFARLAVCHNYPKGNILFYDEDPGASIYVVVQGRVKISLNSEEGREVVLATMNTGGVFGLVAAMDNGPHIGTAVALTDCRIAAVQRERFSKWIAAHPALQQSVDAELARLLRAAYRKVGEQALLPVKKRLLATLVEIARAEGSNSADEIVFARPTQQELAERVGTTRVVVARALKELLEEDDSLVADGRTFRLSIRALVPHDGI
ncbi:MAG: Crp/Fnr family transcriptional regulator [Gemmatimonadota bacterium]